MQCRREPTWLLGGVIKLLKLCKLGKPDDLMPLWVAMQYGYCSALGLMSPGRLNNERYRDIQWTEANAVIRQAFDEAQVSRAHTQ